VILAETCHYLKRARLRTRTYARLPARQRLITGERGLSSRLAIIASFGIASEAARRGGTIDGSIGKPKVGEHRLNKVDERRVTRRRFDVKSRVNLLSCRRNVSIRQNAALNARVFRCCDTPEQERDTISSKAREERESPHLHEREAKNARDRRDVIPRLRY